MKTKLDVIAQVRFQLSQLSARNAHHEFEHLCRFLARARICSNVLPATGPVSAGGDQGRDFETFKTYLQTTSIADSAFLGLVSDSHVVFACTLTDAERLKAKIIEDVKTIMGGAPRPDRVFYFAADDLPVAKRHDVKRVLLKTLHIEVEILDGQAISELLAEPDVFWIAERFLSVPSELLPRTEDEDRYTGVLLRWSGNHPQPAYSFAEFAEIKAATRHVVQEAKNKQDLTRWLELLEAFRVNSAFPILKRRAVYESAVARIRARGTLEGHEDHVREYFAGAFAIPDAAQLNDRSRSGNTGRELE